MNSELISELATFRHIMVVLGNFPPPPPKKIQNASNAMNCIISHIFNVQNSFGLDLSQFILVCEKKTFQVILSFWDVTFWTEKKVYFIFQRNCFKTSEKLRIAVWGSIWGAKHFSAVFVQFHVFDHVSINSELFLRLPTKKILYTRLAVNFPMRLILKFKFFLTGYDPFNTCVRKKKVLPG